MDEWDQSNKTANQEVVSASDISNFSFCSYAWYLTKKFGAVETERMKEGSKMHSPLILELTKMALEEKGYGKAVYCGHDVGTPTLKSPKYRLIGRPDFVTVAKRETIPVEVKSSSKPEQPYPSHLMQLTAYGLLCEENYSRPTRGLIWYRNGDPVEIDISAYREECVQTIRFMLDNADNEQALASAAVPGKKCGSCSQRFNCKLYSSTQK